MLIDIDIPHQEEDQERDHVVIWMEIRRAAPLINKAGGEECDVGSHSSNIECRQHYRATFVVKRKKTSRCKKPDKAHFGKRFQESLGVDDFI